MKIDFTNNSGDLIVNVIGRLDTTTSVEFEEFLNANIGNVSTVTVNCADLEYVSSAGLRVFLAAQKKLKNSLKLTNVRDIVMEVFEITGFADILVIE